MTNHRSTPRVLAIAIAALCSGGPLPSQELPVDRAAIEKLAPRELGKTSLSNLLSIEQLHAAIADGAKGLDFDLRAVDRLLDGRRIDPEKVYGSITVGPDPFCASETRYAAPRLRRERAITGGKGLIDVGYLLRPEVNSEGWTDGGQVAVRLDLFLAGPGPDEHLGLFETQLAFRREENRYRKLPSIVEGPFVNLVTSDHPERVTISLLSDRPLRAAVLLLEPGRVFEDPAPCTRHEIEIGGLLPARSYRYRVRYGDLLTRTYEFRTAPAKGAGELLFAYTGDSREGVSGGTSQLMGVNHDIFGRLVSHAYQEGAAIFLMGGDLISGYTASPDDFRTQLRSWKRCMAGFWHERAVYTIPGNHEALMRVFEDGSRYGLGLDRWPYESESAEALFAAAFTNPANAPAPSDPRRPAYAETAYSFHHGPVKFIAINNNYWYSTDWARYGGCPEGYILEDQLEWILAEIAAADADEKVRHVFLLAQEPPFPNGGHLDDTMWYRGDNRVRAMTFEDGALHPAPMGILDVRNALVRAVAASPKVAAVLGSDEHGYHRTLITREVPIGDPQRDDRNGDGRIDVGTEPVSPLADLARPTWYLVSGGAGAPYYSQEDTPWNRFWRAKDDPSLGYRYSSASHLFLIHVTPERCALRVMNEHGEVFDEIEDLTAVRR